MRRQVGQSSQRRRDEDGVAFGGGVILALCLIDQRYLRLCVLDVELRLAHKVVDGVARLGRLQTFVGRHPVFEGVHNTNLKDKRKQSGYRDVKGKFYLGLILSAFPNKIQFHKNFLPPSCWLV